MDKEIKQILEKEEQARQIKAAAEAKAKEIIRNAQRKAEEMINEKAKLLSQQEKEAIIKAEDDLEKKKSKYLEELHGKAEQIKKNFNSQREQILRAVFNKILEI